MRTERGLKMPRKSKLLGSRIPADSVFFSKVVPILILALAIVLAVLVMLALGTAFG